MAKEYGYTSDTGRKTYTHDFFKSDTDQAVFLGNPLMDDMMTTLVALGAEVWASRRRVRIIEFLMEKKGAVTKDMVEAYVPTAEEEAELQAERDAFIKIAYGHMAREMEDRTALNRDAFEGPRDKRASRDDEPTSSGM